MTETSNNIQPTIPPLTSEQGAAIFTFVERHFAGGVYGQPREQKPIDKTPNGVEYFIAIGNDKDDRNDIDDLIEADAVFESDEGDEHLSIHPERASWRRNGYGYGRLIRCVVDGETGKRRDFIPVIYVWKRNNEECEALLPCYDVEGDGIDRYESLDDAIVALAAFTQHIGGWDTDDPKCEVRQGDPIVSLRDESFAALMRNPESLLRQTLEGTKTKSVILEVSGSAPEPSTLKLEDRGEGNFVLAEAFDEENVHFSFRPSEIAEGFSPLTELFGESDAL